LCKSIETDQAYQHCCTVETEAGVQSASHPMSECSSSTQVSSTSHEGRPLIDCTPTSAYIVLRYLVDCEILLRATMSVKTKGTASNDRVVNATDIKSVCPVTYPSNSFTKGNQTWQSTYIEWVGNDGGTYGIVEIDDVVVVASNAARYAGAPGDSNSYITAHIEDNVMAKLVGRVQSNSEFEGFRKATRTFEGTVVSYSVLSPKYPDVVMVKLPDNPGDDVSEMPLKALLTSVADSNSDLMCRVFARAKCNRCTATGSTPYVTFNIEILKILATGTVAKADRSAAPTSGQLKFNITDKDVFDMASLVAPLDQMVTPSRGPVSVNLQSPMATPHTGASSVATPDLYGDQE
jgi:hypothetical protein